MAPAHDDPTMPAGADRLGPGDLVGGWTVLAYLGGGGFADVYDCGRGRARAAIKLVRGPDEGRLEREAQILARLQPGLAPVLHGVGTYGDRAYLVLERLAGEPLSQTLRRGVAAPGGWAACFRAIAAVVDRVHACGVVHRDLKPDNIWLRDDGHCALLDFGLGLAPELPQLTSLGLVVGTPAYMAPEQHEPQAAVDHRADLYALAVVLYLALAGAPPFTGSLAEVRQGHLARRPPPLARAGGLGEAVDVVFARALAKPPAARYESATRLVEDLLAALAHPSAAGVAHAWSPAAAAASRSAVRTTCFLALRGPSPSAIHEAVVLRGGVQVRLVDGFSVFAMAHEGAPRGACAVALDLAESLLDGGLVGEAVVHVDEARWRVHADQSTTVASPAASVVDWLRGHGSHVLSLTPSARALVPEADLADPGAPPPLVGRAALLDALAHDVAEARQRPGGRVVLIGEAGAGKTRLGEALAASEAARGPVAVLRPRALDTSSSSGGAWTAAAPAGALVLVDDADRATPLEFDRLDELAACGHVVVVIGRLELLERRPALRRDDAVRLHEVGPLDEDAARALVREVLRPVEHVPDDALTCLLDLSRRRPGAIVSLATMLRRSGSIRRHAGGTGHYLATDDLLAVESAPLDERLARRAHEGMPPALCRFAEVCALLGASFSGTLADAASRQVDPSGLDTRVGLARLQARGLVERVEGDRFAFAVPGLAARLASGVPAARADQALAAALACAIAVDDLPAVARLAQRCGRGDLALQAWWRRARAASAEGRLLDADAAYGTVLGLTSSGTADWIEAALSRAVCRYRLQRHDEALADARVAVDAARRLGDEPLLCRALLEEAIVLDWRFETEAEAVVVAEAAGLRAAASDPSLGARLQLAQGRVANRRGDNLTAIRCLDDAIATARACDDVDALIMAGVFLGGVHSVRGAHEEALATYAWVDERCRAQRDRFHEAVVLINRMNTWCGLDRFELAEQDARRAIELAHALGVAMFERLATYNLAECLYYLDRLDEAEACARRALAVAESLLSTPGLFERLLLARIALRAGRHAELDAHLRWIDEHDPRDSYGANLRVLQEMLVLVTAGGSAAAWQSLLARAVGAGLTPKELDELRATAARQGVAP